MYRLRETGVLHMRFFYQKKSDCCLDLPFFNFADSELCDVL